MRRALAALTVVLVFVSLTAVGQSTGDYLDDLFAAQDSLARGIDKACQNRPDHPRCAASTTTTAAPTTTQAPTTTTTLPPTTSTTVAPTTTAPPTTTTVPISTTTTAPSSCQGVQVAAGSNLVTVANAHAAGTTFCVAAGTYQIDASIPVQTGDRWIGSLGSDGARQSLLTGRDSTQYLVTATSQNVLFQNFIVERFNNALQQGVNTGAQTSWTWDNLEVRENSGHGLHTHNNSRVTNSYIHHNGQMGLGGNGDNVLLENNEVAFNNPNQVHNPNWEAGGSKWVNAINVTVRGNHFHDNCGPGIWFDGGVDGALVEDNRVINNAGYGIFWELNDGSAVIRNNYVEGNARGIDANPGCSYSSGIFGIYLSDSGGKGAEVYGNVLVNNEGGIGGQQSERKATRNHFVHDNQITLQVGWSGFRCNAGTCVNDPNIRFENNVYHVPTAGGEWWGWRPGSTTGDFLKNWNEWRAFGHDGTGSID